MKKLGFTLAEVLIALAIIGVVAAMTLPTLVSEYQKDVWAKSLSVAVSDFERAMGAMIMRDGADDLTGTEAWKYAHNESELYSYSRPENVEGFIKNIKEVLNVDDKYKNFKELYEGLEVKTFDGEDLEDSDGFFDEGVGLLSKNDIFYSIYIGDSMGSTGKFKKEADVLKAGGNLYKRAASVDIDVNGSKKPNVWGRDIFFFELGIDGTLYPRGGKDHSIYEKGDDTIHCTKIKCDDSNRGVHYTGRLVENNYKMDY